jgi:hypothetical protein
MENIKVGTIWIVENDCFLVESDFTLNMLRDLLEQDEHTINIY